MPLTWQRNTFPENDGLLSDPYRFQTICFRSRTRLQKVAVNRDELKPIVFALFSRKLAENNGETSEGLNKIERNCENKSGKQTGKYGKETHHLANWL